MVNTVVCVVALLIQLIAPSSLFISNVTVGPAVAGHLITASMFNILLDISFIRESYRQSIPSNFLKCIELIVSTVLMEYLLSLWTCIEQTINTMFKSILMDGDEELYQSMGGDWLPNAFMIALSLLIYLTTIIVTGQVPALRCYYQHVNEAIQRAWQERND